MEDSKRLLIVAVDHSTSMIRCTNAAHFAHRVLYHVRTVALEGKIISHEDYGNTVYSHNMYVDRSI